MHVQITYFCYECILYGFIFFQILRREKSQESCQLIFFIMQDVFILLNIVTYSASQCHCLPMLDVKLIDSLQSLVWQLCEFCTMKNWVWSIYFSCIQESIKTSKFLAFSYILCLIGTCIYVHEYDKAKEV